MIECAIHEDAVEPRAKIGPLLELVEMQVCIEQTLLNDILCILFVASHPQGEVVQITAMTLDERQEHLDIAVVHLTPRTASRLQA